MAKITIEFKDDESSQPFSRSGADWATLFLQRTMEHIWAPLSLEDYEEKALLIVSVLNSNTVKDITLEVANGGQGTKSSEA
jgi:nitrogen regulatory protein PII-like uncharacterized protein